MTAYVLDVNGRARPVKNLGWLLRHSRDVVKFEFSDSHCAACGQNTPTTRMVATLRSNEVFLIDWHDRDLAVKWIDRPSFAGTPYTMNGITRILGVIE